MPDVYVRVIRHAGRWKWQLVEDEVVMQDGPAYERRSEALVAVAHLFPEHRVEAEEK